MYVNIEMFNFIMKSNNSGLTTVHRPIIYTVDPYHLQPQQYPCEEHYQGHLAERVKKESQL